MYVQGVADPITLYVCYTFLNSINSQVVRIKIKISETIRARFTKKKGEKCLDIERKFDFDFGDAPFRPRFPSVVLIQDTSFLINNKNELSTAKWYIKEIAWVSWVVGISQFKMIKMSQPKLHKNRRSTAGYQN